MKMCLKYEAAFTQKRSCCSPLRVPPIMGLSYLQSSIGHGSNANNYRRQYSQYNVRTEVLIVIGHGSNNKQSKVLTVSIGHWSN